MAKPLLAEEPPGDYGGVLQLVTMLRVVTQAGKPCFLQRDNICKKCWI